MSGKDRLEKAADASAAVAPVRRRWRDRIAMPGGRIRKIALYGSSRAVVEGMLGIRGILLAGLLGPQLFGLWALFRLALTYSSFAGLGLLRGLEFEVAKARSETDGAARRAWGRTAVAFTLSVFGLIALGIAAAGSFASEPWLRGLLWAIAAGLLAERLWSYGLIYLRAEGSLRRFAVLELVQAGAQLVLTIGLAVPFGLEGAFIGFVLANLLALALLVRRAPFRPDFDLTRLRRMFGVGVPLSVTLLLGTSLSTVDRLIVGAVLGITALGQYAFAVSVATLGLSAAMIVRTVVFPDLYGRLDKDSTAGVAQAHLRKTIGPFVLLLAPVAGAGALMLGPLIALAAPQYLPALPAASLFIFTGVAQGVVNLALLGIVATGQQRRLPIVSAGILLLNAALAFGVLELGLGLLGLAAATLIGRLIYAFCVLVLVARGAGANGLRAAVVILWPIAWCAAAVGGIILWRLPVQPMTSVWALLLYAVCILPVGFALLRAVRRVRTAAVPSELPGRD